MENESYPLLTLELCTLLAQLASPVGTGQLNAEDLALARKALSESIREARDAIRTLPRAAAQDALLFADALAAASGTLDLMHAGS